MPLHICVLGRRYVRDNINATVLCSKLINFRGRETGSLNNLKKIIDEYFMA